MQTERDTEKADIHSRTGDTIRMKGILKGSK